jgi:hypothetical protein
MLNNTIIPLCREATTSNRDPESTQLFEFPPKLKDEEVNLITQLLKFGIQKSIFDNSIQKQVELMTMDGSILSILVANRENSTGRMFVPIINSCIEQQHEHDSTYLEHTWNNKEFIELLEIIQTLKRGERSANLTEQTVHKLKWLLTDIHTFLEIYNKSVKAKLQVSPLDTETQTQIDTLITKLTQLV